MSRAQRDVLVLSVLLAALAILAPPIGPLCIQVLVGVLLKRPHRERVMYRVVRSPIPDGIRFATPPSRPTSSDATFKTSSRDEPVEARVRAILRCGTMAPKSAVAALRQALSDASEEVRLLAFTRLEHVRVGLESAVHKLERELAVCPAGASALLHQALGQAHYESAYLEVVEGILRDHALKKAREHALAALVATPNRASCEHLLGRVALEQDQPEEARAHFQRALDAGMPDVRVLPYLAECAFRLRDFRVLRTTVAMTGTSPQNATLEPIREVWA